MQCKQTLYRIPRSETEHATAFCWLNPQDDGTVYEQVRGTFLFVSADAVSHLQKHGWFLYDGITWRQQADGSLLADIDGTRMWLEQREGLWLVARMQGNPLGIDWKIQ